MKNSIFLLFLSMISLNTIYGQGQPFAIQNVGASHIMYEDPNTENIGIGTASPHANFTVSSYLNPQGVPDAAAQIINVYGVSMDNYPQNVTIPPTIDNSFLVNHAIYHVLGYAVDASNPIVDALIPDFVVRGNGNTGVGVANPSTKLHIYGNRDIGTDLLYVDNGSPALYVTAVGNTGIGTATPAYLLDVAGDAHVRDFLWVGSSSNPGFIRLQGGSADYSFTERIDVSNVLNKAFSVVNTSLAGERFTVFGDGKTIIGGQSPTGNYTDYLLSVNGNIVCRKVMVEISSWADKVFDTHYALRPLAEVEDYIKVNKHLPEIPSECEAIDSGVDVGEMNKLLLQKVEELTLYVIDLKKEVNALKK